MKEIKDHVMDFVAHKPLCRHWHSSSRNWAWSCAAWPSNI